PWRLRSSLFPYTTLFRSSQVPAAELRRVRRAAVLRSGQRGVSGAARLLRPRPFDLRGRVEAGLPVRSLRTRGRTDHPEHQRVSLDRKSTRLNSSHVSISY